MAFDNEILLSSIEYLKGVGPKRAELLKTELGIRIFNDLLYHFPFRYIDRTQFFKIKDILADGITVQLKCTVIEKRIVEAQKLVLNTSYRNYEIAYMVGFENPTYFSSAFKKYVGVTPTHYVKMTHT